MNNGGQGPSMKMQIPRHKNLQDAQKPFIFVQHKTPKNGLELNGLLGDGDQQQQQQQQQQLASITAIDGVASLIVSPTSRKRQKEFKMVTREGKRQKRLSKSSDDLYVDDEASDLNNGERSQIEQGEVVQEEADYEEEHDVIEEEEEEDFEKVMKKKKKKDEKRRRFMTMQKFY